MVGARRKLRAGGGRLKGLRVRAAAAADAETAGGPVKDEKRQARHRRRSGSWPAGLERDQPRLEVNPGGQAGQQGRRAGKLLPSVRMGGREGEMRVGGSSRGH